MDKLIELKHLRKLYSESNNHTLALDDISLTISKGEFLAIVGTSGSGKSTLLNIIGLLDNFSSGIYLLNDEDVTTYNDETQTRLRLKTFGFVFQHFNLLAKSTVLANASLPLLYSGVSKVNRQQKAVELLDTLQILNKANHKPRQLSGGQQQRVAIARALANQPLAILADEPTGALDSQTTSEILKLFTRLHKEGNTIIVVTHDQEVAAAARRVISLKDGRIISDEVKDDN